MVLSTGVVYRYFRQQVAICPYTATGMWLGINAATTFSFATLTVQNIKQFRQYQIFL